MGWASLATVVRMLMPPWSGRSAKVTLDEELSSLPHDEEYSVLLTESDETIELDRKFLASFLSLRLHSIDCQPLTAEVAEPYLEHECDLYVDGLITLSEEAAKLLSQQGGILWPGSLTAISDEAAKALEQHDGDPFAGLAPDDVFTILENAANIIRAYQEIELPEKFR
jgi:hypothetical protein